MAGRILALITLLIALGAQAPAVAAPLELGVQDDPLVVRLPSAFGGFGAARLLRPARGNAALAALGVDTGATHVPWAHVAGAQPGDPLPRALYEAAVDRVRARG